MHYYLYIFFIFSILGYLMESILALVKGHRIHSGIFYGPWCPVYGFGVTIIILIFKFIEKANFSLWINLFLMFISAFVLLTILEALGGILIEKIFGITFWDYTPFKWNIGKYVALEISLGWGILSLFLYFFILPLVNSLIKILPFWPLYILLIISSIDILYSSYVRLKKK